MKEANIFTKEEIQASWKDALSTVSNYIQDIDETSFLKSENGKWSIGENLDHLIRSTKPIVKVLGAPKLGLRMMGKPKGPSRNYNEVVNTYHEALVTRNPPNNPFSAGDELKMSQSELIDFWNSVGERLSERLEKWKDSDLDKYVVPHPLLGKMTIREILFFTIYHSYHHLKAIEKIA